MAKLRSRYVNGNLIFYDTYLYRWLQGIGPDLVQVKEEFVQSAVNVPAASASPISSGGWTATFVEAGAGDTTLALKAGADGGVLLLTTDANEDDGANLQLAGEAFSFASAWPCYFGIRCKLSEATQSDFLAGLCITDTTLTAGMTDGVYFRKADGSTQVVAVLEKDSTETTGNAVTMDTSWHVYEIFYDGASVDFFVDGVAVARLTQTNLPNDEYLTPSFEFLNGDANPRTVEIDWIRAIQVQNA